MKNLLFFLTFLTFISFSAMTGKAQNKDLIKETHDNINLLKEQKFDEFYSRFDTVVSKILSKEKLSTTWKSVITQVGELQEIVHDSTFTAQSYPMVISHAKFEKMDINLIFGYNSSGKINTFRITPFTQPYSYKNPYYAMPDSFTEQAIYFGKEEWKLPGTLSIPKGNGKFPVAILVHGSGPNDRDETYGPNKPFKDIALGLSSRGIAVLRYEKRTKVYGEKFMQNKKYTLYDETIEDALEAVNFLKTQNQIDPDKIFIIGHSLGALAAPRIVEQNPDIAGAVIMAGPTRNFADVVLDQVKYIDNLDGKIDSLEQIQLDTLKAQTERVKSPNLTEDTPADMLVLGICAAYWLDLRTYNPVETAQKVNKPFLILQGERDYQVNLKDYEGWRKAFQNNKNFTLKLYPKIYHMFIEGDGRSTPQEYLVEGHVAEYAIRDIAKWIKEH